MFKDINMKSIFLHTRGNNSDPRSRQYLEDWNYWRYKKVFRRWMDI